MIEGSVIAILILIGITSISLFIWRDILAPPIVLGTCWLAAFGLVYFIELSAGTILADQSIVIVLTGITAFVCASFSHQYWFRSRWRPFVSEKRSFAKSSFLTPVTVVLLLVVPVVFYKAVVLSQTGSTNGFLLNLRNALNYSPSQPGFGWMKYLFPLSLVTGVLWLQYYSEASKLGGLDLFFLFAGVLQAIVMLVLSTGRTSLLLFAVFSLILSSRKVRQKQLVVRIGLGFSGILLVFALIAQQLYKGFERDQNSGLVFIEGVGEMVMTYWAGGLVHFSDEVSNGSRYEMGRLTFRTAFAAAERAGMNVDVAPLVQAAGNDRFLPGNVYTAYYHYYEDWGALGVIIVLVCLGFFSNVVYQHYRQGRQYAVVAYGLLFYIILMQPFQEQLFSLTSQWIQVIGWFWLFQPDIKRHTQTR